MINKEFRIKSSEAYLLRLHHKELTRVELLACVGVLVLGLNLQSIQKEMV